MAYSNVRYTRTRHSPKLITPIQARSVVQPIQKLQPEQAIQPYYPYSGLDEKRRAYERARQDAQTKTFLSNYNDPTELNSYIDALVNREAVSKKFGDTWGTISTTSGTVAVLAFAGAIIAEAVGVIAAPFTGGASIAAVQPIAATLAKVGAVASIPAIPAAADVTYNTGIKPIVAGKPKEAALNTLMNLGETMDLAANPVKGLVMEGPEGFVKGLGVSSAGRVNYDYDTGFFLTDMLLEVISDPTNWISFGTAGAIKSSSKALGKEVTENITKEAVGIINKQYAKTLGEIGQEGAERVAKQVANTAADVAKEWTEKSFTKMSKEMQEQLVKQGQQRIQTSLVNALKKELPKATASDITTILQKVNRSFRSGRYTQTVANLISDIRFDKLTAGVLKGLSGMRHYSDTFERFMMKGALRSSGFGLGIDAIKKGFSDLRAWMNERTLTKLVQASVFDKSIGLDIKNWEKAKNIWIETGKQTSAITGEVVERNVDTFYAFANQQFNRDMQLIREIQRQYKNDPIKIAAALDAKFTEMYGVDYLGYINTLKQINALESGQFIDYINYAEAINSMLARNAVAVQLGAKLTTGEQLYGAQNLESLQQAQIKVFDKLYAKATKLKKTDAKAIAGQIKVAYTLKLNDYAVNATLMNDPDIAQALAYITSSEDIGAILNNIINDIRALAPENSAIIPNAVRTIKEAGIAFTNMQSLYDNIAKLNLPKIDKISDLDFKRYIIDQIFGANDKSVTELLAGFDDITVPNLMHNLEVFLQDVGFNSKQYSGLQEQIAQAYKTYLEAQQRAGLDTVNAAIVQDFTKSVRDLIAAMPDYADDLQFLVYANNKILYTLKAVREQNEIFLSRFFAYDETIFKEFSTRQLSDVGLALKTIALQDNINLFDLPTDISGAVMNQVNNIGKSINNYKAKFKQYPTYFTENRTQEIMLAYKDFRVQFIDNPDIELPIPAFKYLKPAEDVYEAFAQLVEFNKSVNGDKVLKQQFQQKVLISKTLIQDVTNPSAILKTEFAWDLMAKQAHMAEQNFNEMLINSVTAYNKLGLYSKKMTNDFAALRNLLSTNKLDRPLMLQQERYIRIANKYNETLEHVKNAYINMFDNKLAKERIEYLRNIFLYFPELSAKYGSLVDTLEGYWNGTITFKQSPKYMQGDPKFIDEFTPFWDQIKLMNDDINVVLKQHNDTLYEDFSKRRIKFDKEEFKRRAIPFDKEELARRKIKFDTEEFKRRSIVQFDKEEFKKRMHKFDMQEYQIRQIKQFDKDTLKSRFKKFNIKDVPIEPNMSRQAYADAVLQYKQQVQDYNKFIYDTYKAEVNEANAPILKEYKEQLAAENEKIYKDYITELREANQPAYTDYIEELNEQNNEIYEAYIQELNAQNDPIYKAYIAELDAYNDKLYKEYVAQRFEYSNVSPWDPMHAQQEFNKRLSVATDQNAKRTLSRLFTLTPEQFAQELAFRHRFVTFKASDVSEPSIRKRFGKFLNSFKGNPYVLSVYDAVNERYWFVLKSDVKVNASGRQYYFNDKAIARRVNPARFDECEIVDELVGDSRFTKSLNELDNDMQKLIGASLGDSQGDYLSKENLEQLFSTGNVDTGVVPKEVWEALPKKDGKVYFDKQFFDAYHFNESILGTSKSKRALGLYSSNMLTNLDNTITHAQAYLKPKVEYVHTVFDSQFSIGNPKGIYAGFSDEDLLAALQLNPDYKLIALVDDAKYGVKTREILPTSVKAIQKARELGAVIVPLQTYKDMYNVVNHRLGSSGMSKLWNRIMYVYKFGYLLRPGAWIRNWFDTNIKSKLDMGDEFFTYKNQATKLIQERERIHELVKDSDGIIRMTKVKEYLAANPSNILSWETYQELELDFFSQGVSGNIMRQVIGDDAWATFTDLTGRILALPNKTEDYNRLAYYLYQLDKGYDTTSALAKLSKTHFDYSFKTKPEQLAEMFFPFTTFSLRNYSYWIEQIERHPWIMQNYVHLMKPGWDFKDYTPEELARNYAAQNQILNGQIKLGEFNDRILTFKANPSIQDAIRMATDPLTAIYEKLATPISMPLNMATGEYTQPTNLIPVIGPMIQSGKQMIEKGTPLPSAIGVQKKWKSFKPSSFRNSNYKGMNNYRDKQYRVPRYRNNMIYDSYSVKGVKRYRLNLYPIIDIAYDIKSRYSVNVYNRIKSRVETDVFKGIRYRLKLDVNRFR